MLDKKRKFLAVLLLGMSLIIFAGCGSQEEEATTAQPEEEPAALVEVGKVVKGNISSMSQANGKIVADLEVSIIPKMAGKVAEVNFAVGDTVHKGDVIIRLESSELEAQLKQAQAALTMAQANYDNAVANLERTKSLFEQGAASKQQLDAAQTMVATGNPASAAASVEYIKAQLANTVVKSPVTGIVSSRSIEVGEIAAQMAVMTIVNIDQVKVDTYVLENEVNKLKIGQKVDVVVSALGEEPFAGTIDTISPAADGQSNTFPVTIKIPNAEHKLKPGMFAEINISLETKNGVLLLPKQALMESGNKKSVFAVQDNKAVETEITTGVEDGAQIEVLSGLKEGDQVVLTGQNKLQTNTPVTIAGGSK
ncbi:MAG: efflux RND transporter periplasmic adaptor subunit [Dehalobacterium sp.]